MCRGLQHALLISTGLLVSVGGVTATTITTTSFATWKTDLTGSPAEANFGGVQMTSYNTSSGIKLSAVGNSSVTFGFTGPDNGAFRLSGTTYHGITGLAGSTDSGAGINVAMPSAGENAILLSVGSTSATPLTLTLSDGESFSISSGLFGFSISHTISSMLLTTSSGSQAVIDDLWYGNSSLTQDQTQGGGTTPTSEGSTLLLGIGGSLVLVGARRKFSAGLEA